MEKTNNIINNIEFKYEKEIIIDNNKYLIKLGKMIDKQEELIIFIKEENEISSLYYQDAFSLEQLYKINKCFKFFDSIDETIESLKEIINEKRIQIRKNDLFLECLIKINKIVKGEEEFTIKLSKNNLSSGKIIEYLIIQINEMKKDIKQNKEDIKKINIKLDKLLLNDNSKDNIDESKIISTKKEINFVSERIKGSDFSSIKYQLLYRGTRDGMNPIFFYENCKKVYPTLCLIETSKGCKFGGYTEQIWVKNGQWIKDDKSFVFSIDKMKIYNIVKGSNAIYFSNDYGPAFDYSFYLHNDYTESGNYTCTKKESNTCFFGFKEDYEINRGLKNFQVKEIEAYKVIID